MTIAYATFDTLRFAKKLEAAGVEPKIAEAQAELQAELQAQILDKFTEYQPVLDEIKITKGEFATKADIRMLKGDICMLENKIDVLRNELIIKLGGIVVGSISVLGIVIALLINHSH